MSGWSRRYAAQGSSHSLRPINHRLPCSHTVHGTPCHSRVRPVALLPRPSQLRESRAESSRQAEGIKRLRLLLAQAKVLLRDQAGVAFMEDDPGLELLLAAERDKGKAGAAGGAGGKGGLPPRPGTSAGHRASGEGWSGLRAWVAALDTVCMRRRRVKRTAVMIDHSQPPVCLKSHSCLSADARQMRPPSDGDGPLFKAVDAREREKEMQRLANELADAQSQLATANK
mgnify:CR=1 FL=1